MLVEAKLKEMGLELPAPLRAPEGFRVMWRQARVVGTRVIIAGHARRLADGTYPGPFGKVGSDLTVEEGYLAARLTALSVLGDLKREIGDLDRVTSWLRVFGMVNSAPGFIAQPQVIDGFTDLIVGNLAHSNWRDFSDISKLYKSSGPPGYTFTDPAFGSTLIRVTDGNTRPSAVNVSYRSPSASPQVAWNTNATYFYVVSTDGTIVPFSFNANTMTPSVTVRRRSSSSRSVLSPRGTG